MASPRDRTYGGTTASTHVTFAARIDGAGEHALANEMLGACASVDHSTDRARGLLAFELDRDVLVAEVTHQSSLRRGWPGIWSAGAPTSVPLSCSGELGVLDSSMEPVNAIAKSPSVS